VGANVTAGRRRDKLTVEAAPGLVDPATPAGVQPVGRAGYTLVFSDEFAAGSLNRAKWDPWYPDTPFWNAPGQDYAGHKSNTNEPQIYDPTAITFSGSEMIFTLSATVTNPYPPAPLPQGFASRWPYTSGMVTSYPSFNQAYGYFEARIKCPYGEILGPWSAFWMDRTDQQWPPEIDWWENFGGGTFYHHRTAYITPSNYYYASPYSLWPADRGGAPGPEDWHTYAGEWRPGSLRWYVDGNLAWSYDGADVNTQPMYLICNLAGYSGSSEIDQALAANAPFSMHVDYIRAWA
jgi:serralysin